jgi:Domain of unknown function (DUF4382)
MKANKWLARGVFVAVVVAWLSGCGGGGASGPTTRVAESGSMFVNATDAPLPSVVSFQVDVTGMTVSDGVNPPVSVLNGTQTVDFARLNGLHTLLDLNTVPAGTYTSVTVTLANPQIGYLNVTNPQTTPPTHPVVTTLNATSSPAVTLTQSAVTVNLASPIAVNSGDTIGLSFDFDLRDSIQVDSNGQITGAVNPTLKLKGVTPSDSDAYIDEFVAGVVSVNASGNSFVIQGPFGHQFTVNVNDQTEWEGDETIADLTTSSIVEISGTLDRTSKAFLADTVAIVSQDKSFAGGLITWVDPPTGTATDFDLYVRASLPSGTGFQTGQISTIDLIGNEKYFLYWWHNKFTNLLFNSGLLVPGQHVSIGGPFSNGAVTVKRVVLRHEGHSGTWVVGSTNVGAGTFQFNSNGLAGVLFDGPVTVYCTPFTVFRGGLTGLNDLTGTTALHLRVVGLVLKDPVSGQPVFVAQRVEEVN